MPVDYPHDSRGDLVLSLVGGQFGQLVIDKFSPKAHDSQRNRFTSHFATCVNAAEHRGGR